jgi:hypothetical protein
MMYSIWERDPDDPFSEEYTLWGDTTNLDEAIDVSRDIHGYVTEGEKILADHRKENR